MLQVDIEAAELRDKARDDEVRLAIAMAATCLLDLTPPLHPAPIIDTRPPSRDCARVPCVVSSDHMWPLLTSIPGPSDDS